ncbi:MAG TPA: ABC transporter permease subunit [Symbiobacteriaceae bacterium]|jgi:putative spermidine/putrescine transport system permease protein
MRRLSLLWFGLPLVPLVLWSVAFGWRWPDLLPAAWSFRAWHYLGSPPAGLGPAVAESLFIALAVTLLALLIGVPAGKALGTCTFRGRRAVEFLFYLPIMVPGASAAMGLQPWLIRLGLTDRPAGVVLVHLIPALPYLIRAATAGYAALDPLVEQQARTLGATPAQAWRLVVLPALAPALAAGAGLVFIISLSQYLLTLLIGGGKVVTLPLLLFPFISGGDRAIGAALSLVFTVPGLLLFWLLDAWLRRYRLEVRL